MKKSFLALALGLALGASVSQAATKKGPSYSGDIKANPLGLALGYFNASYEFPVGPSAGLNLSGSFYSYGSGFYKLSGFGAGGMYRFYSKGKNKNLNSFYYGPMASFASVTWKFEDPLFGYDSKATIFILAPGFGLGRQWIFNGGFTLDLRGGIVYYISPKVTFKDNSGNEIAGYVAPTAFSSVWPAAWFSLGYAFAK